jgi:hypothetical protein
MAPTAVPDPPDYTPGPPDPRTGPDSVTRVIWSAPERLYAYRLVRAAFDAADDDVLDGRRIVDFVLGHFPEDRRPNRYAVGTALRRMITSDPETDVVVLDAGNGALSTVYGLDRPPVPEAPAPAEGDDVGPQERAQAAAAYLDAVAPEPEPVAPAAASGPVVEFLDPTTVRLTLPIEVYARVAHLLS